MINPIIDKADHKAQHAADKEADGIFDGAVVFDVYHDQLDDADHGQNQSVQSERDHIFVKARNDAYDGKDEQADADRIIHYIEGT